MDISVLSRVDSLSPLLFSRIQSGGLPTPEEQLNKAAQARPVPDRVEKPAPSERVRSYTTTLECVLRNLAKGAALGYGGRTAFSLLGLAMRHRAGPGHERTLAKALLSKEHAHWAAFLSAFLGLHNGLLRCQSPGLPPVLWDKYRNGAAGVVAGASLRLAPPYARPYLALLLSVRAAEVLGRSAAAAGQVPEWLQSHADVKLMMAASSVVMTCWIFEPELLEPMYLRFLNKQSGKDTRVLRAIAATFDGGLDSQPAVLAALNAMRQELALPALALPPTCGTPHCNVLHLPSQSCESHICTYAASGWLRAASLYAPVHLLPLLLFRPSALMRKPIGVATETALKVGRSALFLSSYCAAGFATLCLCARTAQAVGMPPKRWHAATMSSLCGLALLFEKPGRRLELALYTTLQALRCWPFPTAKDEMRKHLSVPAFALACGVLSHHFARHPHAVRSSYRAILTRFLDTAGDNHRRLLS